MNDKNPIKKCLVEYLIDHKCCMPYLNQNSLGHLLRQVQLQLRWYGCYNLLTRINKTQDFDLDFDELSSHKALAKNYSYSANE